MATYSDPTRDASTEKHGLLSVLPGDATKVLLGTGAWGPIPVPPSVTTTAKNAIAAPVAGQMVLDMTLGKLCFYDGAAWKTITST